MIRKILLCERFEGKNTKKNGSYGKILYLRSIRTKTFPHFFGGCAYLFVFERCVRAGNKGYSDKRGGVSSEKLDKSGCHFFGGMV